MSKVKFMSWDCNVTVTKYLNGNTALELWDEEEGPIATATVNVGDRCCSNRNQPLDTESII